MWNDFVLVIVLLLLTAELGILYFFLKYNSNFLKQIQSIKGIQLDSLDIGEKAPSFRTFSETGEKVISKEMFSKKRTLILFINTNCPTCKSLLADINSISSDYDINFLLINSDNVSNDDHITKQLDDSIIYIRSNQITSLYFIRNVPHGVLIDESSTIILSNYIKNINVLNNMLLNEKNVRSSMPV
ncbi:TlpA family protein disulfide reductase [Ornithinibacillus bavariensis]|uniref:Thioredoxin domain-containing protein n=1 Tax=Ornithinibacillus bavariensis TaxID=545502 RepID=A0A920C609_9BACI|nr:redoxin domain-containing protein [Ornithinibacillus bavariensis]GIO27416.1 hypothetical protein J43TS3_20270 [Ornithinibacillus bavariensis]HAM82014.1 hypothetical protein [Ornithinibacillus sp.]